MQGRQKTDVFLLQKLFQTLVGKTGVNGLLEAMKRQENMHGISRDFMQELNDQCAIKFGQLDEYNASA